MGRKLSLVYARGIDTIAGFEYMSADRALQSEDEIRQYLQKSLAEEDIRLEMDGYDLSLAYYDPVLKMPFIAFRPKTH